MTLQEIVHAKEGDHYEFKKAENRYDVDEGAKYLSAMSNYGGGRLVLGVTDKRPRIVVGSKACPQPESTVRYFMDKLHVRVDFDIYHDDKNNRVLVFEVASRPVGLPVQFEGVAWWRDGDSLVPMPEDVRRSIYAESGHDFSSDICPGATLEDLDKGAIDDFRKRWFDKSGNNRVKAMTVEQLLVDCGAITDRGVTYAALILFGTDSSLSSYLAQAEVVFEYRSKNSAGPAQQRVEFRSGFFTYFDRIWELIDLRNDKQDYQDGFFVLDVPTFNERVAREAVLNAVSHRNYQMAGCIYVRQYNDRLVIESPGGFPVGISLDNILTRQSPRNRRIAQILALCGLVERAGQGMNLMYELSIKEAKPLPDFTNSDTYGVFLTLNGLVFDKRMLQLVKKTNEEKLDAMTTDDYILLSTLFKNNDIAEIPHSRFEHLIELGLIKRTDRGLEVVNGGFTIVTDNSSDDDQSVVNRSQSNTTTDIQLAPCDEKLGTAGASIGRQSVVNRSQSDITTDRKKKIISFIKLSGQAKTSDLIGVIELSDGRVRALLREMVDDGSIQKIGNNRYTYYVLK